MVAARAFSCEQGFAVTLSLLLWLSVSVILASPVGFASSELETRKPPVPSLEDCKNQFTAPPTDKAMYFTGLKTDTEINAAKSYAMEYGLVHVSLSYPTSFTDRRQYHGTDDEKKAFQKAFSQVYAEGTTGIAYLLIDDDKQPTDTSIFLSVEFPAMKDGAQVTKIIRFPKTSTNPTGSTNEFWPDDQGAAEANGGEGLSSQKFCSTSDE